MHRLAFAIALLVLTARDARADVRTLTFTYTTDTLPGGSSEIDQVIDMVPLRAMSTSAMREQSYAATALQTELGMGLTDRAELTLSVTLVPELTAELAGKARFPGIGTGLKQRLRIRVNEDPHVWPVIGNFGVVLELTENDSFVEAEGRLLFERLLTDRLRLVANIVLEHQWLYTKDRVWVFAPTAGAAYEVTPRVRIGLEGWSREEYPQPHVDTKSFAQRRQVYAGPTLVVTTGRVWWTTGVYLRLSEMDHDLAPGDPYGRLWVRTMIGYALSR